MFPTVDDVGDSGFGSCDELTHVVMRPRIIGWCAFFDCYKLSKFDFSNVESIGCLSFASTSIERVIAPKLADVGRNIFFDCKLKTVDVPKLSVNMLISKKDAGADL